MQRTLRVLGVAAVGCALAWAALPVRVAVAHAAYRDSDPPDGATVSSPPTQLWAEFTEQPSDDSRLDVFDPCGAEVDGGDSTVSILPGQNRITVSVSADRAGKYRVDWHVLSTEDGHTTAGTFTFTATGGKPCPGSEPTPPEQGDEPPDDGGDPGGDPQAGPTQGPTEEPGGEGGRGRGGKVRDPRDDPEPDQTEPGTTIAQPTATPPGGPAEPDIPMDGLLVALSMAALIGAAGGRIYAGIVGPPRA